MQAEKTYLRTLALATLLLCAGIAGLNWLANPFSLFNPPSIARLNVTKPGYIEHLRLTHAYRVAADKPDCIVLGTSRTGRGLRPDHPALARLHCYNLSLPAISMYEMRRYLQHAQAVRPLTLAILSIDFRVFNTPADHSGAFVEARLAVDSDGIPSHNLFSAQIPDMVAALLSISAVEASLDSIRRQGWVKDSLRRDGLWVQLDDHYDHAAGFEAYTSNTLRRFAEASGQEHVFQDNLNHFRLMLREAYAANIDLRLLIPPSHAWHWQSLYTSGLWPRFEEMKRHLVTINGEEAQRAQRSPYPTWDFSGSWGPSLEAVPRDKHARMHWFWEPVHFKTTLGDLLLDRIMDTGPPNSASPLFGVKLDAATLPAHLEHVRALQEGFARQNPEVAEHIRTVARRTTP